MADKVDRELIRALAALLTENNLTEIEWAEGERRIRVVRSAGPSVVAMPADSCPRCCSACRPKKVRRATSSPGAKTPKTPHFSPRWSSNPHLLPRPSDRQCITPDTREPEGDTPRPPSGPACARHRARVAGVPCES